MKILWILNRSSFRLSNIIASNLLYFSAYFIYMYVLYSWIYYVYFVNFSILQSLIDA